MKIKQEKDGLAVMVVGNVESEIITDMNQRKNKNKRGPRLKHYIVGSVIALGIGAIVWVKYTYPAGCILALLGLCFVALALNDHNDSWS